jgi:hypothetical protein
MKLDNKLKGGENMVKMKISAQGIEIYFDDLNAPTREAIVKLLGNNGNYDVFPIATIEPNLDD